jgi:hypothetical protein
MQKPQVQNSTSSAKAENSKPKTAAGVMQKELGT